MVTAASFLAAIYNTGDDEPLKTEPLIVLMEIASKPGISASELSINTKIPQQTISRHTQSLGSGKALSPGLRYIEGIDDPYEQRRKLYFLTKSGVQKVKQILSTAAGKPEEFAAPSAKEWLNKGGRF